MFKAVLLAASFTALVIASPAGATVQWRKPDAEPGFKGLSEELRHLADRDGHVRINSFCAVVESEQRPKTKRDLDGGFTWVLVHWKQERLLYTFGAADDKYGITDLNIFHSAPLDLRKDVVATRKDIGSSTYLVTKAWVTDVLRHCKDSGTQFTIIRSGGK